MKGNIDSMDEQKQLEDRWRELDELLGLGAPSPPPKIEQPAEPAPVARQSPAEAEHERRIEEEERPPTPETSEPPEVHWEAEFDEDADTEIMDQEVVESLPVEPGEEIGEASKASSAPDAPGEDEDKPRRGRRRRRRGRRKGGPEQGEGSAPAGQGAPPHDRAAPREPLGNPRDQGRPGRPRDDEGHRRPMPTPQNRPDPEAVEMDDFQDDPPPPLTRAPVTVDDTDFSDWDVPSWQDLISSLYRPDR
jgi:hypothetical protein